MRQFVSNLIFITGAIAAPHSFTATASESNYCEAILYGTDFGSQMSLYGDEFGSFARKHPEWRVAISWGKVKRFRVHLRMNEPVTGRALPSIPAPQDSSGTRFTVATVLRAAEGHEAHATDFFRVLPLQEVGGGHVKYALATKADSPDRPLTEVDIITLFLAMAAVPYADHLVLEQHLSVEGLIDLDQALPLRTLQQAKRAGRADSEALNLVAPRLARSLIARGGPFQFIGRRHFISQAGHEIPTNLESASRVHIQYHFKIPSLNPVLKRSF